MTKLQAVRRALHRAHLYSHNAVSAAVVGVLSHLGVKFRGINVLEDDSIREGIKAYSDWPTIPQLYVKGEFVGGCDIIREMYESGELTEMFQTHGIDARPS